MVGAPLLRMALDAGHEVTLLARSAARVPSDLDVTIVEGDALDPELVGKTIVGCDAVLSTLGGRGDADAIEHGTANIVGAMRTLAVHRLVVMQGFHLHLPGETPTIGQRLVVPMLHLGYPGIVRSSRSMAAALATVDDIDWTLLRAPRVVPGGPTGNARVGALRLGPWSKVSAGDVAATMLGVLDDASAARTTPMVCSS